MLRTIATTMVLLLGATVAYGQNCCLSRVGDDPQSAGVIRGIQAATILLLVVPALLVGAVALRLYFTLPRNPDHNTSDRPCSNN